MASISELAANLAELLHFEKSEGRRLLEAPLLHQRKQRRRQEQQRGHRSETVSAEAVAEMAATTASARKKSKRPDIPMQMCRANRIPACNDPAPKTLLLIGEDAAFTGDQRAFLDKILLAIGYVLDGQPEKIRARYPEEEPPAAVLTMGHHPTAYIVRSEQQFLTLLGKFHVRNDVPVMPIFDPAMTMQSDVNKRQTWSDLKNLLKHLELELPPRP